MHFSITVKQRWSKLNVNLCEREERKPHRDILERSSLDFPWACFEILLPCIPKNVLNIFSMVVWIRMAPSGPYVWILSPQLVELFREEWEVWSCGGGVSLRADSEASKAHAIPSCLSLLHCAPSPFLPPYVFPCSPAWHTLTYFNSQKL